MTMADQLFVVYHVFQAPGWQQLFAEQMGLLFTSGLFANANVTICVDGEEALPVIDGATVVRVADFSERPSLIKAREIAQAFPSSSIFYMHTKGISHPTKNQDDWRMMMQHFLIVQWKEALRQLIDCDVVTVNWRTHPRPHCSGNFWWAKASYLSSLDPAFMDDHDRFRQEFWIGSGTGVINCLHESGIAHYDLPYPPSRYCADYYAPLE